MKNFTLVIAAGFLFVFTMSTNAQQKGTNPLSQKQIFDPKRCGTWEDILHRIQTDPVFRAHYEEGLKQYEESLRNPTARTTSTSTLTGPVTIPIVVHIVLPQPDIITDADVLYFINRMNLDYSGFNSDSTNGSLFYSVRGHSLLRWTLAKRDASGNYTTGIERRVGAGAIAFNNPQPIKVTASGGLDPWDITQYFNIWVGVGSGGLLGIAPEIGPGGAIGSVDIDGPCVDYRGFSRNPGYSIPAFCGARTAVHEIGHCMGLYHPFDNGCSTNDFAQLTSTGCQLPPALLGPADDVPVQSAPTSGCPTGGVASGCTAAPLPPGKMYQNYMDYTDDPCYSMFSIGEVQRMEWVLENCRADYLTTLGGTPPASAPSLDAALTTVVRPGGSEFVGPGKYTDPANGNCATFSLVSYPNPTCGASITPKLRIQNRGITTLTSITVNWTLNNGPVTSQPVTLSGSGLATLYDTVITLTLNTPITLVTSNTLKFWTSNPNGSADQNNANDTITKIFNFAGLPLPITQGFESTTFPPAGWSINNPNNNNTWYRATAGNQSTASAGIDTYNNNFPGNTDDVVSPPISTMGWDSVIIKFDLAHKNFPGLNDHFQVLVSTDCGTTFTPVLSLDDPTTFPTAGSSGPDYVTPAPADWAAKRIAIGGPQIAGGQVIIAFRVINGFGNRTFLDNINITGFIITPRDVSPVAVLRPNTQECTPTITPSVTVLNNGIQAVDSFEVRYILDNGAPSTPQKFIITLNPGASTNVTLTSTPFTTTTGNHTIKLITLNPGNSTGVGDLFPANDTISKTFTVNQVFTSYSQNFESAIVPAMPAGITVVNPNGNVTWVTTTPGNASQKSAFIDNYDFNLPGQIDDMKLPAINTTGIDSVILTFDVSHRNFPGLDDILSVIASTDCGNNYLPTGYSKPGTILQTAGASTAPYLSPTVWRKERVAVGGAFMSSGSLILTIRNTNGYGNNIFIDNINVTRKFKRDIAVVSIAQPNNVICTASNAPSVAVQNVGSDSISAYNVSFTINGGAASTSPFTPSPKLAPGATATVTLNAGTFIQGANTLKVYTSGLVTTSGAGDQNTSNDTLTKIISLVATIAPPVVEGFENTTFPPTGWAVVNPDNSITWRRTTAAAKTGIASAFVNNFQYPVNGQIDDMYTPRLNYTGVDSVSLSFDMAALTSSYPGTTTIPLDTLEVLITKDCGNTFTSVYKKWGADLQTVKDPNYAQPSEFFPLSQDLWRSEKIDLTGLAAGNGPLQVVFRNTSNFENNIFIDNVNVSTRTLPLRLKSEGFLVLPSPFKDQFTVWHYLPPTDLKYISVYSSAGQLVWRKDYGGNADKQVAINLSNRSAGVYIVHLGYTDPNKNVSVRIVKY